MTSQLAGTSKDPCTKVPGTLDRETQLTAVQWCTLCLVFLAHGIAILASYLEVQWAVPTSSLPIWLAIPISQIVILLTLGVLCKTRRPWGLPAAVLLCTAYAYYAHRIGFGFRQVEYYEDDYLGLSLEIILLTIGLVIVDRRRNHNSHRQFGIGSILLVTGYVALQIYLIRNGMESHGWSLPAVAPPTWLMYSAFALVGVACVRSLIVAGALWKRFRPVVVAMLVAVLVIPFVLAWHWTPNRTGFDFWPHVFDLLVHSMAKIVLCEVGIIYATLVPLRFLYARMESAAAQNAK